MIVIKTESVLSKTILFIILRDKIEAYNINKKVSWIVVLMNM